MADVSPTALHTIPFITDVDLMALGSGGIVARWRDSQGRTLARTVADADRMEALAHALLAIALASRKNARQHIKLGHSPRIDVNLMPQLTHAEPREASTVHAAPPLDRLARLLPGRIDADGGQHG